MALKSAQMAGLTVPRRTIDKAIDYLNSCMSADDNGYGYVGQGSTPTMTAAALLCRQHFQAWDLHQPEMNLAVENHIWPFRPSGVRNNAYFHYYATQVMRNNGGTRWKDWNESLRGMLITGQEVAKESPTFGSWSSKGDLHGGAGGRLMVTSLCLLTLEVYYRYPCTRLKEPPPVTRVKDPPDGIATLIFYLRTGVPEEMMKSAERLTQLGEKARAAAPALCAAATHSSKSVSRAALEALEKVAPNLYEPVFTLLVDAQAANHRKAIAAIRGLGLKAGPALPVITHRLAKCEQDLRRQQGSWGPETVVEVTIDLMRAVPEIAPGSSVAPKVLAHTTNISLAQPITALKPGGVYLTATPFRAAGVPLLGQLGAANPDQCKKVVAELMGILDQSVLELKAAAEPAKGFRVPLLDTLADVESICSALYRCEPTTKEAVSLKVLPELRELTFHKEASVREAAKNLKKRVESGRVDPGAPSS
jgi:hypothetical protein